MAIEGVNGANNNTGIYTAGAALVGGAGGAAAGWYSKPFLKDGAPTDSFTRKIGDAVEATMPQEIKEYLKPIEELSKKIESAKTLDEFKELNFEVIKRALGPIDDVELFKETFNAETLQSIGLKQDPEFLKAVAEASCPEDILIAAKTALDKEFDGKTLPELLEAGKARQKEVTKASAKMVFEQYWDADKKAFISNASAEDKLFAAIKKAAQGIQVKTAAIYGGIGAAVLGLATYLIANNSKKSE